VDPNQLIKPIIQYHMASCAAFKWGRVILLLGSELSIGQWENCTLYILFITSIVILFFSLCCSVTLSFSQTTSFAFFFQFSCPSHREEERESDRCLGLGLNHARHPLRIFVQWFGSPQPAHSFCKISHCPSFPVPLHWFSYQFSLPKQYRFSAPNF